VTPVADLARQGRLAYFFADWPTNDVQGVPVLGSDEGRPVLERVAPGIARASSCTSWTVARRVTIRPAWSRRWPGR
jgi:hypothetical protein